MALSGKQYRNHAASIKSRVRQDREKTWLKKLAYSHEMYTFKEDDLYRTVTDWELGSRHAPDYVMRLLEYYICTEELRREKAADAAEDKE